MPSVLNDSSQGAVVDQRLSSHSVLAQTCLVSETAVLPRNN